MSRGEPRLVSVTDAIPNAERFWKVTANRVLSKHSPVAIRARAFGGFFL